MALSKRQLAAGRRPLVSGRLRADDLRSSTTSHRPRVDAWISLVWYFYFYFPARHYLCKWSTLAGWLQHMPTLARPCPKTSNIHNFWTVAPKIMKFVLTQSLFRHSSSQKVSRKSKNSVRLYDATQNRFGHFRYIQSFRS